MTLDTFFKKFDQFADAPDAVAKMRELVLELAVQGKLVDQKKGDGNAVQLLAEISRERDARAELLRTPKEPVSNENSEHAFQIPPTWVWTQLGNIALQIQYGYTASADHSSTEVRMLRITDIQNNRVNWPTVPGCQITKAEAEKYLLIPNDILIARTGGTIGKSFIIPDAPVRSVFASYLIRVTPPNAMEARFLKIFLETPLYWKQLQAMSAGTGQPNVNGQALGRLELPLPPLAEQKRIVAKVDELMALCDRLEAQQQERDEQASALARASLARFAEAPTPANLNLLFHKSYSIWPADLRKAVLTLAVQGKLVKRDPNERETSIVTMEELVGRKNLKNGLSLSPTADPTDFVCLPLSAVNGSNLDCSYGKPIAISSERAAPYLIESGDVFIMRGNGSKERVGIAAMARTAPPNVLFPDLLIRVPLPPARIDGEYFLLAWNNPSTRKTVEALAATTAGIWKINQGHISECTIPLPPLAEQCRIVAKVDQLMVLVAQLETQLVASRATAKNLLDALVAELTQSP